MSETKKKINYIVVCVNEFADRYNIPSKEAFTYLFTHQGIVFLKENYDIEHTLSIEDAVDDLTLVCRKNGGNTDDTVSREGMKNVKVDLLAKI